MPRKSIYFTDELLPRALEAAELDDRSLSAWTMLAVEAKLAAGPPKGGCVSAEDGAAVMREMAAGMRPADADVLRAAAALPKTPSTEEYATMMSERQRRLEVQRAKAKPRKAGS